MATCHQVAGHVRHLVVLPKIFAALPSAEKHMCLVLALQARQGPNTQDKAERLMATTGHLFEEMMATYHSLGVAGKVEDYTTTTSAAPTPTPCTFIALPDVDPTSCLGRVNHHRTKWVLPPQSENTALHGCVN